jgi:ribonuclease R
MMRALYHPECRGHYALASRYYTHFTSPIRRYPDLVVHRGLKSLLAGRERGGEEEALLTERLPGIAEHASFTERRAEVSERELLQWKKVRFLAERVGETFPGHITGVQPFGLFVQLDGLYVDGLIPIRLLEDDYYVHEPAAHRLVGSDHGRVFQLADPIEVRLIGASLRHRGLDLVPAALAEHATAEQSGGGRRDRPKRRRRG